MDVVEKLNWHVYVLRAHWNYTLLIYLEAEENRLKEFVAPHEICHQLIHIFTTYYKSAVAYRTDLYLQ